MPLESMLFIDRGASGMAIRIADHWFERKTIDDEIEEMGHAATNHGEVYDG